MGGDKRWGGEKEDCSLRYVVIKRGSSEEKELRKSLLEVSKEKKSLHWKIKM